MISQSDGLSWSGRLAGAVDEKRLWDRHLALASYGAREDGGVNRPALSREDGLARLQLKSWADAEGYDCFVDDIGNLFIRREGLEPGLPPVLTGSHLDSQPAGGKFDGVTGVLAGLEALQAFDALGIKTKRAIEVVSWTNEEGSRFAPGVMGSAIFAGELSLNEVLTIQDSDGTRLKDALETVLGMMGTTKRRQIGFPTAAYVELHIEQGPMLESSGSRIGIVTGIQGTRWFEVEVNGTEAHAGTTPARMRKDALGAATAIIAALRERLSDPTDTLRFTVGRMVIEPNSPNTVPGKVTFSVDLRHPRVEALAQAGATLRATCTEFVGPCGVSIKESLIMDPVSFHPGLVEMLAVSAQSLSLPIKRLMSGAFHDAKSLAAVGPSAMIFIPCAGGVSHNPAESVSAPDIAAGARVLALALAQIANLSAVDLARKKIGHES